MPGVKVFVFLFIILVAVNAHHQYYHYKQNGHRHNHGCWGYNQCARRGPPVCEKWCIVYVVVGFCPQARYECCSYREKPGYCPAVYSVCSAPLSYYITKHYECRHDFNCPVGYKCCKDSCFTHKVCKPCTSIPPQPLPTTCCKETEETTRRTTALTTAYSPTFTTPSTPPTTTEEETTTTTTTEATTTTDATTSTTLEPTETTTQEVTTTEATADNSETTTPTTSETTVSPKLTTEEVDGSGDGPGSGAEGLPEPEAAKLMFDGFTDDEDLKGFDDYGVY